MLTNTKSHVSFMPHILANIHTFSQTLRTLQHDTYGTEYLIAAMAKALDLIKAPYKSSKSTRTEDLLRNSPKSYFSFLCALVKGGIIPYAAGDRDFFVEVWSMLCN